MDERQLTSQIMEMEEALSDLARQLGEVHEARLSPSVDGAKASPKLVRDLAQTADRLRDLASALEHA